MPNDKIYIHETIQISVERRKEYLDHFCSWGPTVRKLYDMHCFGVWATVGSTDVWPEAVVMWELAGLDGLARMLSGEFAFLSGDAAEIPGHYDLFWASAPPGVVATSGYDRVLVPTASSPTIEQAVAQGIRGSGYYHETARVHPTRAVEYLEMYEAEWRPFLEQLGLRFVGAYRTLLRNDSEALALWALPEWGVWVELERARGQAAQARAWIDRTLELGLDWEAKLLTPASRSPMDAGERL